MFRNILVTLVGVLTATSVVDGSNDSSLPHQSVKAMSVIHTANRYDFIVSIPDVHGDLVVLLRSLWMAYLTVHGKWNSASDKLLFSRFVNDVDSIMNDRDVTGVSPYKSGGSAVSPRVLMIQTGDIIDRGPQSKSCYEAIWAVETLLGWDLVNLFGNHEVMTFAGQADHYAHPGDVKEFGSLKARRSEFAPGGKLWTKITNEFKFIQKVNIGDANESILFVHAGIDPGYITKLQKGKLISSTNDSNKLVHELNVVLLEELKKAPASELLSHSQSIVWTRDLAQGKENTVCNRMFKSVKELLNITRLVVGHTPQENLATGNRCDGTLLLADVALSRWMGSGKNGNPAALIFTLSNNGNDLARIDNMYWKGAIDADSGLDINRVNIFLNSSLGSNQESGIFMEL